MLELLRKDASLFISKILLGFIVLVFILYFGFNFTRKRGAGGGTASPIARVNGQIVPVGLFHKDVENQMALYQQFNTGKLPPDTQKIVQGQVLQKLVQRALLAEEAHRLGLRVPDRQLADEIRKTPAFTKDGQFREDYYLGTFKPYYDREFGQDFEFSLRQELLGEKLQEALEAGSVSSEQQIQDAVTLGETRLKLRQFSVPIQGEGQDAKEKALEAAQKWIQAQQSGKPVPEALKAAPAKEETLESKTLQELQILFGGEDSLPIFYCLLQTQAGKVCESPFQVKQNIVAVQLLERSEPPASDTAKIDALRQQLNRARQIQTLNAVNDYLTKHAKVETYLTK
jgi:hypothetical protein